MVDIIKKIVGGSGFEGFGDNGELIVGNPTTGQPEIIAYPSSSAGISGNDSNITGLVTSAGPVASYLVRSTFTSTPIPMVDEAGIVAYGNIELFDIPVGVFDILCRYVNFTTIGKSSAGIIDTFDSDFAIGTNASNNTAALGGNEANVLASQAVTQAVAGVTSAEVFNVTPVNFTSTDAKSVYLNYLVDDADQDVTTTPANILITGTAEFVVTAYSSVTL